MLSIHSPNNADFNCQPPKTMVQCSISYYIPLWTCMRINLWLYAQEQNCQVQVNFINQMMKNGQTALQSGYTIYIPGGSYFPISQTRFGIIQLYFAFFASLAGKTKIVIGISPITNEFEHSFMCLFLLLIPCCFLCSFFYWGPSLLVELKEFL